MRESITGILIVIGSLLTHWGEGQSPSYLNKSFDLGRDFGEWGQGMIMEDSSYVGTGIQFIDSVNADVLSYFSMDKNGNIEWKNIIPSPYRYGQGGGRNFQRVPDSNYLNAGSILLDTINFSYDSGKAFLMKVDQNGQPIWENWYRPQSDLRSIFHEFHVEWDGDIVAVGRSRSSLSTSSYDMYVVKTDPQGNMIWERTFGGGAYDDGVSITPYGDGYVIAGSTKSYGNGDFDGYLVKIDTNGNKLWQKTNGTSGTETQLYVTPHPNGGFIGVGGFHPTSNNSQYRLVRFNESFDHQWEKVIGHPDSDQNRLFPIVEPDGSILFGGDYVDTARPGDPPVGLLIKTDSSGNILWEREYVKYEQGNHHYLNTLLKAEDGGYLLYGNHTDFAGQGQGGQNLWLIKTDSVGCDTPNCSPVSIPQRQVTDNGDDVRLYPNPARDWLSVKVSGSYSYQILNGQGKVVREGRVFRNEQISVEKLSPGLHILRLQTEDGIIRKKFLKR